MTFENRKMVQLQQISALLDYLENHPELALSLYSRTNEGRELAKQHWVECAEILNSFGPDCPIKTPSEWRMFYNEYKCKLVKKIKHQYRGMSSTGVGHAKKFILTPFQERLYGILRQDIGEQLVENDEITVVSFKQEPITSEQPLSNQLPREHPPDHALSDPALSDQIPSDEPPSDHPLSDHPLNNQPLRDQPQSNQPPRRRRLKTTRRFQASDRDLEAAQARLEHIEAKNAKATWAHANATQNLAAAIDRLAATTSEATNKLTNAVEKIGSMIGLLVGPPKKKHRSKIVKVVQEMSSGSECE